MFQNTILNFLLNMLVPALSHMLSRLNPFVLLGMGLCMGVWITYMAMRDSTHDADEKVDETTDEAIEAKKVPTLSRM